MSKVTQPGADELLKPPSRPSSPKWGLFKDQPVPKLEPVIQTSKAPSIAHPKVPPTLVYFYKSQLTSIREELQAEDIGGGGTR